MKILSPHFSCVVLDSTEFESAKSLGYPEIYYPSTTGLMKYHKFRGEKSYVAIPVDKIPGVTLVPLKESHLNFLPDGPIPFELFDQIKSFFLSVMETHKSDVEAMIWILYNKQDGYHLFVPEQVVSKASAKYEWAGIPAGSQVIVDIHSHNTMGAFFSGTDDGDDRIGIRFSGVFGRLNDAEPQTVWRFNYMDKHVPTTIHDIFAPRPGLEYTIPQEWLDKVKVHTYAPLPYQSRGKWTAQGWSNVAKDGCIEDDSGFWTYPGYTSKSFAAVANGYYATGYEDDDGVPFVFGQHHNGDVHDVTIKREVLNNNQFKELVKTYGPDVADAYWDATEVITHLAGNDTLLMSVANESIGMLENDASKVDLIRKLYESLGEKEKSLLETNGF